MPAERLLLCALLAASTPLVAAEPDDTRPPGKVPQAGREATASPELLEFLGSWETATGTWNETMPDDKRAAQAPARRPKETTRDKE